MFSFITKNLNWKILTKNSVTFKRWDGVKDEKLWASLKNSIFRGGHEKPIYRGENCLQQGLGQFTGLRGGLAKKKGWFWEGDWYPSAHYGNGANRNAELSAV